MTRKPGKVIRAAQIQSDRGAYRIKLNPARASKAPNCRGRRGWKSWA